jgi:hypothetical protein
MPISFGYRKFCETNESDKPAAPEQLKKFVYINPFAKAVVGVTDVLIA